MKGFRDISQLRSTHWFRALTLCLALSWLVGCTAMMKTKKPKIAQDKFSCGDPIPGRIP
jgi:hypothetical protein